MCRLLWAKPCSKTLCGHLQALLGWSGVLQGQDGARELKVPAIRSHP